MPFTDDDLKRLKAGEMSFTTFEEKLSDLITRLEVAENALRAFYVVADFKRFPILQEHLELWREACGHDPESLIEWDRRNKS